MNFFDDLIDLVLPDHCAGCGRAHTLLCGTCAAPLQAHAHLVAVPPSVPPTWTIATYQPPVQAILSAYKERGRTRLAIPLGEALATATRAALNDRRPTTRRPPAADKDRPPPPSHQKRGVSWAKTSAETETETGDRAGAGDRLLHLRVAA